jgi:hypothetical protein
MIVVAARAAAPRPTHQAGVVKRCLVPAFDGRYLAYIIWPHFTILFDSNVRIATHLWAFGLTVLTAMATTTTANAIPMTPLGRAVHQQAPPSNTPNHSATRNQAHATNVPPSSTHNATVASAQTTTLQVVPAALPTTGSTAVSTKKRSYCIRWSPVNRCIAVSGLIFAVLALAATLYFSIMSGPGSLADRRAIWSSRKDFRATCISELESGLSLSPSCNRTLAQPAEPPPDLQKRDGMFMSSSYVVRGIVLALMATAVTSALLYTTTRFFGSLRLTTVAWERFDVNERNRLGIVRTFKPLKTHSTRSTNPITRARQVLSSSSHSHEHGLLSARVLTAYISSGGTTRVTARIVPWKELCQQSKTRHLNAIKVPLPPDDGHDIDHVLLGWTASPQQGQGQSRGSNTTLRPERRYRTVQFPWDAEECDYSSVSREHLYVLLDSALLERRAKHDFGRDSEPVVVYKSPVRYSGLVTSGNARLQGGNTYIDYEKRGVYGRKAYHREVEPSGEERVVFGDHASARRQ